MAKITKNGFATPNWYKQFGAAFASTSAFIFHGNVSDYVVPGKTLGQYLTNQFLNRSTETKREKLIIIYDRAEGIRFILPEMEAEARRYLDMEAPEPDPASMALGIATSSEPPPFPKAPSAALPLLEKLLTSSDYDVMVFMRFAEHICPTQDVSTMTPEDRVVQIILRQWGTNVQIRNEGQCVIMATELLSDISPAVRAASACWQTIELPIPNEKERLQYIEAMLPAFNALEPDTLVLDMAPSELARATAGLGLIHIEKIFMQAAGIPVSWELVRNAKRDIIASEYAGLLELLEPTINFENVGGMEPLKNWARDEIIGPIKAGQTQDVPGGVLLVGPPGTGKTFFVRALAAEVGFQCVAYHQENIMSKWQGESERNMLRALGVVRSLAPVLLFMDELDQSDTANRGQASGSPSAKNLFNQILQFLSDPTIKGKVIFIGASNRPDLLDPALMRFGRIDAIVPVMLPDEIERRAVLEATVRSQDYLAYPEAIEYLTEKTAGYSCADLAAVVTKARKLTQKRNRNAAVAEAMITLDDAKEAFATIRPATLKQAPYFEALALDACNDTSLLPEAYRSRLDDRKALTKQIQEAEGDAFPTRRRL